MKEVEFLEGKAKLITKDGKVIEGSFKAVLGNVEKQREVAGVKGCGELRFVREA